MKIFFYKTSSGRSPVREFIDEQRESEQARIFDVIVDIEVHGLDAARIVFKPLEGKLWEIKFRAEDASYRVLYVLLKKDEMIWLHAFKKKSQKTPFKELDIARKRMKEVL